VNGNGLRPASPVDELDDDADLLGLIEITLRDERERLRATVDRCDALSELRRRALAIATASPDERTPVTGEMLREHALSEGGEEELARLESELNRIAT